MSNVFDRVLLAGGIEATFRTAGTPNLLTDSFDVGDLNVTPNIARLERNVQRPHFSPVASRSGRKQQAMSFVHEVMGSGRTDGSRPPPWGRLMRACGFAQTQFTTPSLALSRAHPQNKKSGVTLGGAGSAYTGTMPRLVVLEITSATQGKFTAHETPNGDAAVNGAAVTITSGQATPTGVQGGTVTLTFTAPLVVGDKYLFWFVPPGYLYSPVSDPLTAESLYLHAYMGNKRHLLTGARGTVAMTATGGELAAFTFNFTGDWNKPTDIAWPTDYGYGDYPLPPMVELADVSVDGKVVACPTTYGFDMANATAARLCANAKGANDGAMLTGRSPTMTFNMDSVPLATMDVWGALDDSTIVNVSGYIGTQPGNTVMFLGNGQFTNTQYADLDGLRKNDNTLGLVGIAGNDELLIFVS